MVYHKGAHSSSSRNWLLFFGEQKTGLLLLLWNRGSCLPFRWKKAPIEKSINIRIAILTETETEDPLSFWGRWGKGVWFCKTKKKQFLEGSSSSCKAAAFGIGRKLGCEVQP